MTSSAALPSRLIGAVERIPASLAQLAGPDHGRVELPVRLAWSGPADFDVSDPQERLTLYCLLLDCGQRDDIVRYVNAGLLRRDWPRVRRLTARRLVSLWERRLPDLAAT
ncbi:hypothetical protein GA0074695_6089 [Micromonospora viridifaciens]|uniref:Uncharacterized protein n=1 Tax=Micromonospora viridifaciens TaxID=1881 RepID=A0A1C4ZTU3_MICVI|nr:hypothetical protein [Micromonospora viridifaciens]SCF36211.1 hypothetical protein GA0074695_6089 [Micromonospora viridifaciens]